MDRLDSIRTLLLDYLHEASQYGEDMDVTNSMIFYHRIYDAFFNLIADCNQSSESMVHLLDTFSSGLDGFSSNKWLQGLISHACFESLAKRKPKVLNGSWETLVWVIVKSLPSTNLLNKIPFLKDTPIKETRKFITEFCSPELCPNPCLRLELLRFLRTFDCYDIDHDKKAFKHKIINTLCESCDEYISPNNDQAQNIEPIDIHYVMKEYNIDMGYLSDNYDFDNHNIGCRNIKIITAVLKLTRKFALLEKEKQQCPHNEEDEADIWNESIAKQLSACLSFCGLIPEQSEDSDFGKYYKCLDEMKRVVSNDCLLQNYVIEILDTITQISLPFPYNEDLQIELTYMKSNLLYACIKVHVNGYPSFQYLYEMHGGLVPDKEYRLRYFQNNLTCKYINSDNDPDRIAYDGMNGDASTDSDNDFEESDSEIDISD